MSKSYQQIAENNNCPINDQVTYSLFILNEFIDFLESIWIFSILSTFSKKILNERNVTNLGYVFVPRFHITHKNFLGNWTNSCTVTASIFFQKWYFEKRKKNGKNWYGFWKINKFIWNAKKGCYLIIYRAKQMFLIPLIWVIISNWCYIAKYWNSDRFKLFVANVCAMHP